METLLHTHTQTLPITGMTCEGCEYKIQHLFEQLPGVISAKADRITGNITLETERHIRQTEVQELLKPYPKYKSEVLSVLPEMEEEKASFWIIYQPLLLIFAFITGVSVLTGFENGNFSRMLAMQHFMAGFFLTFSFFKLLNLKDFASSYAMYDLLAKRIPAYGFVYPFIELALGIAYLTGFQMFITSVVALVVMSFSSLGVVQSLLNKQKIRCACLGAVFNLPMSTVTLVEDLLMVAMAGVMLLV
jgi:copper chaperone CopZ